MKLAYKYPLELIIILAVLTVFTPALYAGNFSEFKGQINAGGINVRSDATIGSASVCMLGQGDQVEVVSEVYDWYKIRLPKIAPSYIKKELVECINLDNLKPTDGRVASASKPARLENQCINAKVIKDRVNIRLGPGESSWILGKVDKLTVVNILGSEGAWYKIEPVHQSFGWVNRKFIDKAIKRLDTPKQETESEVASQEKGLNDPLIIEGIVSPYGVVLWRKATHKLVTQDEKIYFLKGNRKALDSLNFHKVKVTGTLIAERSKYPIVNVAILEALN